MIGSPPPPPEMRDRERERRVHRGAIPVAVLAAAILPGATAGLNVVVVAVALGSVAAWARREDLNGWSYVSGGSAVLLAAMFAVHTSEWVLTVDLIVAGGLGVVALSRATSWTGVLIRPPAMLLTLHRGLGHTLGPLTAPLRPGQGRSLEPAVRGAFLALFLVSLFGGLFVSADPAFGRIAHDVLLPDWDLSLLPARVMVGCIVLALAGAYVLVPVEGPTTVTGTHRGRGIGRIELAIALGALDLLFIAFVTFQIAVLFGGRGYVLSTAGLTYAEYARQGFFQLVAVAALALGVIAATLWLRDSDEPADRTLVRGLLGILCVGTLVVLASAFIRLTVYEEAYGFTRLRLAVHATIVWLAILFVLVMVAGAIWDGRWLPRAVVLSALAVLLPLNLLSPDAFVAERNLVRYEATGRFDAGYAATLGAEAVPVLLRLPEPLRACAVEPIRARLARRPSSWISFNLAEARARDALAHQEVDGSGGSIPASCYDW
ncbi:MAG: DUF4173 domain-containing protein [Actinobacteria bacterium]|nr:DUF4173 domain-containing protein [Actinomycetota bacterium]